MAPRYKLTLDSLKFISLVDTPAQESASIRLLKRKGAADVPTITATAKIMKLGEGADPLIYGWAFTCTGPDGSAYHDLQGDAITEFVKAAEAYFAAGAPADEMHKENAAGRIAFGMPMDGDIAKAFFGDEIGKLIKTSGLMIAVRATPEALAKVKDGTYTGFSIAGTGTRELIGKTKPPPKKPKGKKPAMGAADNTGATYKRVGAMAALTSIEDGHQHTLDLDDPADCWRDMLMTSYQTAEGATEGHCHAWVYDGATGKITIAMDSGHTHTIDSVVPQDVIAAAAAPEPDETDAVPCPACDDPSGPTVVVQVAARAPATPAPTDSTQPPPTPTVKQQEQVMPTAEETLIANLRKMLEASLALTDAQRAHVLKLSAPTAVETFLLSAPSERESVIKAAEAADPVVYTTTAGLAIHKSHGPVAEQLARQADTQAAIIKSQTAQLEIQKAAAEQVVLEKRAGVDLSHFAKSVTVGAALLRAIDGIADEAVRKDALEGLRGMNVAMKTLGKPIGSEGAPGDGPVPGADDPNAQLAEMAKKHAAANAMPFAKAYDAVLCTPEGAALYEKLASSTPKLHVVS